MQKIRLALVEDHTILRQTLARTLQMEFDMEVGGTLGKRGGVSGIYKK